MNPHEQLRRKIGTLQRMLDYKLLRFQAQKKAGAYNSFFAAEIAALRQAIQAMEQLYDNETTERHRRGE